MGYFIINKGVERNAELEDILPVFGTGLQYILRDASKYDYLPYAIAHLPYEMKKLVYSNLLSRIRARFEKEVEKVESECKKDDGRIQNARSELISFIGENYRFSWCYSDSVVWKETKPKEPISHIEKLINDIENACVSGSLFLSPYDTNKISEEDLQNAFMAFKTRKDKLQRIRHLDIDIKDLPAAFLFFETGGIESLEINGEFVGIWPEFLKEYHALTSINLSIRKGLIEFPSWIRNAVSLCRLSIDCSNITLLPEWIGEIQSLRELVMNYGNDNLKTLPDSICNLKNLSKLSVYNNSGLEKLPDSIGNLSSLRELSLDGNEKLTSLPDSISDLKSLSKLFVDNLGLEKLPDSIGNLSSLKELYLYDNKKLLSLPDSIGNLSSLKELYMYGNEKLTSLPDSIGNLRILTEFQSNSSFIKALPDCIGNLQNLATLSLYGTKIETLPDSIGNLKKLTSLNLCGSGIKKLPETIADCSSLECLDIRKTNITSVPDYISSIKEVKRTVEVIPKKRSISYGYFCNYYYTLVEAIFRFSKKARLEGLLSLEEEMDSVTDGFFMEGIRLVIDGTDGTVIRELLTFMVEREHDYYIKKLKEIALEGILCILNGDSLPQIGLKLAVMVDIKNNPLDTACQQF